MTLEDVGSGPNGLDAIDGDANSGPNGLDASAGENNYETDGDINGSDWLSGESFLSDDEDEEMVLIKNKDKAVKRKIKSKIILAEDLKHVVFNDVLGEDGLGSANDLREDSEGDSSTKYLESSDVEMIGLAREELSVEINKDCCQKAKKWALEHIRERVVHEFSRLFDYMYVLRSVVPNGNFELMVRNEEATPYGVGPSIPATSVSSQPLAASSRPIPIDPSILKTTYISSQLVIT
ncbi:hypothetical protein V6N12_051054 [Hibiscus sabdariffa]|uniref:Uncharacterized protein n=1 Tax=Hibiscus sabdariffa TaxID=183260 RepID=A0ABR2GE84_9ROSI